MSIKERNSGQSFLIDSGADECVYPATPADLSLPQTSQLVAANGSIIRTFGKRTLPISFGAGHEVLQPFWIATAQKPILGADFFRQHDLLIDVPRLRLLSY